MASQDCTLKRRPMPYYTAELSISQNDHKNPGSNLNEVYSFGMETDQVPNRCTRNYFNQSNPGLYFTSAFACTPRGLESQPRLYRNVSLSSRTRWSHCFLNLQGQSTIASPTMFGLRMSSIGPANPGMLSLRRVLWGRDERSNQSLLASW